jgi:hypothetical protein
LRGEVGAKRRVRGLSASPNALREASHPNLLPVKNGERERRERRVS